MLIKALLAREILDSRGNPTIEAKIILKNGMVAKASVPSGASTGKFEALELRDGDKQRYGGKGVLLAVKNVNTIIAKKLIGQNVLAQQKIDRLLIDLDGTDYKSKLGANAMLAVSLVCARAAAMVSGQELYIYLAKTFGFSKQFKLPVPAFNIFNGGAHASTNMDFQEFMVVPVKKTSFARRLQMGAEIYHALGKIMEASGMDTDLGNEGGYAPDVKNREQVLQMLMLAFKACGYRPGKDVGISLDVGSSELYDHQLGKYILSLDKKQKSSSGMISLYRAWIKKYPLISIEDGLAEEDWSGWQQLTKEFGKQVLLIGDDLFVTNISRIKKGIELRAANAVLIKPNQIGTLSETMAAINLGRTHGLKIMVSHRSGETTDDFVADLAVAVSADYVKFGAPARGERVVKYNRLAEIEINLL